MFFSSSFIFRKNRLLQQQKKRSGIIYLHRSAVYISLSDSLSCVFSCFNQLCKCCGVCDSYFAEHLSVHFDAGFLQTVHEC